MRKCWRTGPDGYRVHPRARGPVTVVVVGDSAAAGYGVCDPSERFADQVAARLGDGFSVYVVAENDLDTRQEWARLQAFPKRPDVLVLSYLGNDIEGAATEQGLPLRPTLPRLWPLAEYSYLVNFAYWRRVDLRPYLDHYRQAWADPTIAGQHLAEVAQFFSLGVPVVVVVWPVPFDPALSLAYVGRIDDLALSRGAAVVDVGKLTADLPLSRWMATANDAHPSAEVHRRVGASVYEALVTMR